MAGGVPVRRGGRLIGALSIGGGAPEQDFAFATEALGWREGTAPLTAAPS